MWLASYNHTLYRGQSHLQGHVFPGGLEIRVGVINMTPRARLQWLIYHKTYRSFCQNMTLAYLLRGVSLWNGLCVIAIAFLTREKYSEIMGALANAVCTCGSCTRCRLCAFTQHLRVEFDKTSIFILVFSFSWTGCLTETRKTVYPTIHSYLKENRRIHAFSKG